VNAATQANPIGSAVTFCGYLVARRVHFPRDRRGQRVTNLDGRPCTVVMQGTIDPAAGEPARPAGLFRVRFHLKCMSPAANRLFLHLPVPLLMGLPGFRSKLWLYDEETGDFQGRYEWDTIADAQRYAHSFAVKFMTWRSLPGSVSYSVTANAPSVGPRMS
jgi:hypothetical protein